MALTLVQSGSTDIGGGGPTTVVTVTAAGAYSVVVNLANFTDSAVAFWWSVEFDGGATSSVWGETVAITGASTVWGLVTPPIPITRTGTLIADLDTGSPTTTTLDWDLYRL